MLQLQLVLELCLSDLLDSETIQQQLDRIRTCSAIHMGQEVNMIRCDTSYFVQFLYNRTSNVSMYDGWKHLFPQISDKDVETSVSHFLKLIETLLEQPAQREHYFQVSHPSITTAPPNSFILNDLN